MWFDEIVDKVVHKEINIFDMFDFDGSGLS
jgi:hypothetical protein